MEEKLNFTELAKQGIAGICVLLIVLVGFIYYKTCDREERITNLIETTFTHNTQVMEQLKAATENNVKATTENTQVLRDLKTYLISQDGHQ